MPIGTIRRPVVNHRPTVENPTELANRALMDGHVTEPEMCRILEATGADVKKGTGLDPADGKLLRTMYDISLGEGTIFDENAFKLLRNAVDAFGLLAEAPPAMRNSLSKEQLLTGF